MSDPTGTAALRRAFLAEGNRRFGQLRSQTHAILVERDLMAARGDRGPSVLSHPGDRLAAFSTWFAQAARGLLLDQWWARFLERGYASGQAAGEQLLRRPAGLPLPMPSMYYDLATREFSSLVESLIAGVTRQAASAAVGHLQPQLLYRAVAGVLRKTGPARLKGLANDTTVRLHNAARLTTFGQAGVTRVGIDPERMEPARPSRFLRHQHDHWVRDETRAEREAQRARGVLERERVRLERAAEGPEAIRQTRRVAHAEARVARSEELRSVPRPERNRRGEPFVAVETAGDHLVCARCNAISEAGPYTLARASRLIPVHPSCRCTFVPADEGDGTDEGDDADE